MFKEMLEAGATAYMVDARWLFIAVVISTVLILIRQTKIKSDAYTTIVNMLLMTYVFIVLGTTIFPFIITFINEWNIENGIEKINYMPLYNIIKLNNDINFKQQLYIILRNYGGNIALFMPLGFIIQVRKLEVLSIKKTLTIAFLASLSVELIQFLMNCYTPSNYKIVDIDDLIMNTIGALLGYLIFVLSKNIIDYDKLKIKINGITKKYSKKKDNT